MSEKSVRKATWISVDEASRVLGVTPLNLRRKLEARARRGSGGIVEAVLEGVVGRKWGRLWRVALDQGWLEPGVIDGASPLPRTRA